MSNIEKELTELLYSLENKNESNEIIIQIITDSIHKILYRLSDIPGYETFPDDVKEDTIFGELLFEYEHILSHHKQQNIAEKVGVDSKTLKERFNSLKEMKNYLLSVNELTYDDYELFRERIQKELAENEIFYYSYLDLINLIETKNFFNMSSKLYDFTKIVYKEIDPQFQYLPEEEIMSIYEQDLSSGYIDDFILLYFVISIFDFIFAPIEKKLKARMEELKLPEEIRSAFEIQKKAMEAQKDAFNKMEEIKRLQKEHSRRFGGSFLKKFF